MRYIISGRNITVTEGLKEAIYDKLGKLEKYFTPETEIIVTLSVEKQRQKIEVTVPVKGHTIRAEQSSDNMYVSRSGGRDYRPSVEKVQDKNCEPAEQQKELPTGVS